VSPGVAGCDGGRPIDASAWFAGVACPSWVKPVVLDDDCGRLPGWKTDESERIFAI
jgi:hypothetical protein